MNFSRKYLYEKKKNHFVPNTRHQFYDKINRIVLTLRLIFMSKTCIKWINFHHKKTRLIKPTVRMSFIKIKNDSIHVQCSLLAIIIKNDFRSTSEKKFFFFLPFYFVAMWHTFSYFEKVDICIKWPTVYEEEKKKGINGNFRKSLYRKWHLAVILPFAHCFKWYIKWIFIWPIMHTNRHFPYEINWTNQFPQNVPMIYFDDIIKMGMEAFFFRRVHFLTDIPNRITVDYNFNWIDII